MKYFLPLFAALATIAQAQQPPPPPEAPPHGNPPPPAHQPQALPHRQGHRNAHAPVRPNADLAARVDALQRQLNELRAEVRRLRAQSPARPQAPLLDARRNALRKAMEARRSALQQGRPIPEARLRELRSRIGKSPGQPQLKKKPAKPAGPDKTEKLRREKQKEKSKEAGKHHADYSGKHHKKHEAAKDKEHKEDKHENKDKDGSDDDGKDRDEKDNDKKEA
jgi:hypothetical protein